MENRGNRASEELAKTKAELRGLRSSARPTRHAADAKNLKTPNVDIRFEGNRDSFSPGDFLICEYDVETRPDNQISAIETSVIWLTEGKGDEDIGVHFFERRDKHALTSTTFNQAQRLSTVLPVSPLSYEGQILKVRWAVRVRIFLANGEEVTENRYFRLGSVVPFENRDDKDGPQAD